MNNEVQDVAPIHYGCHECSGREVGSLTTQVYLPGKLNAGINDIAVL